MQGAPIDIDLQPFDRAVRKRDACVARGTTGLYFKFAIANLLLFGMSQSGHYRESQENGQEGEALHHCSDFSVLRSSTKRMAIGRPATAFPMPSLKCNGVQRASVALTASR